MRTSSELIPSTTNLYISQSEIVFIFMRSTLGNPQDDRRKHEAYALRNIGVAVIRELLWVSVEDVLQYQQALQPYRLNRADKKTVKKQGHTTLPASPPAMSANPTKRTTLALQTALESPKPSSPRTLSLSIRLMIKYPRREQMPGTQSTKLTCTGGGASGASGGPQGA